jgi:hypothetical protein
VLRAVVTAVLVALVAGCGAQDGQGDSSLSPTVPPATATSGSDGVADSEIVGVWQGEHECLGIAEALTQAGFDEQVVVENLVGNGVLLAAPEDLSDLSAACAEAVAIPHSHEFTSDGQFFSYDGEGNEVDFGTYELVDEETLSIGAPDRPGVTFDYSISGDELRLEPQLEPGCLEFECQWALMVAMPWTQMERVEAP